MNVARFPPKVLWLWLSLYWLPCTCVKHYFASFPGDKWMPKFYTFILSQFLRNFATFSPPDLILGGGWGCGGTWLCPLVSYCHGRTSGRWAMAQWRKTWKKVISTVEKSLRKRWSVASTDWQKLTKAFNLCFYLSSPEKTSKRVIDSISICKSWQTLICTTNTTQTQHFINANTCPHLPYPL